MSSYLLLRNNIESGPFTIDEIKGMSLKAYDLIWIVGKSAAWRYPGEISEMKPFAPPVPDQVTDLTKPKNGDQALATSRETNKQSAASFRSVYVYLPSEKKLATIQHAGLQFDRDLSAPEKNEAAYDFSDIYKKKATQPARFSSKILWFSTIVLLFGAGLLTGFFISDRRKFFSTDAIHPQSGKTTQPVQVIRTNEIAPGITANSKNFQPNETAISVIDSLKHVSPVARKSPAGIGKKNVNTASVKKDSAVVQSSVLSSLKLNDTINQRPANTIEMLNQKIKAHPENYINLVTGRYSTGVFGGISSFPVSITNNSSIVMGQVVVSIDYIQNNQKIFKTESLSFSDLEPGETVTLKAPKSPRGIKISTHIRFDYARQPQQGYSN